MKINSGSSLNYDTKPKIGFRGNFLNNKLLLKGLEFASENNSVVTAGTTVVLASLVRPIAILSTPNSSKKDKQIACSKSIASSLVGFGLTMAIFKPVSKAFDKVTKEPESYLKSDTIQKLKGNSKKLDLSPAYNFIKQSIKLSPEFIAIVPKAILTIALITPIMNLLFEKTKTEQAVQTEQNKGKNPNFKGASPLNLSKRLANIINKPKVQEAAQKYKDSNFMQHMLSLKDVLATLFAMGITEYGSNIDKKNKKPLIYNMALSTGLTICGGYAVNELIKKPVENFTSNFIKANKNDPNLHKYLNGIKVMKPILILGTLYYIAVPMLSTFWADKLANTKQKVTA